MHKSLFVGTLLGVSLLGVGCQESGTPASSTFVPRPVYVNREPAGLTTRLTGFTVDPEAYFINLATCSELYGPVVNGRKQCPLPPLYAEFSPLFQRSTVRNSLVTVLDTVPDFTKQPPAPPAPPPPVMASAAGLWTIEKVPTRPWPKVPPADPATYVPPIYLMLSLGEGALANDAPTPFPLPPVPVGNYVPTAAARPVVTGHSACVGLEAIQVSDKGILEAVAKYLSTEGTAVTVQDLLNPARYAGVTVFWLYRPGFPVFRVPADNTTVTASAGRVFQVEWAPPGALPPPLAPFQSTRGFFIAPTPPGAPAATVSSVGIVAIVHPPLMGPPVPVVYTVKDPTTSTVENRPWKTDPIVLPPTPGVVTFAGLQLADAVPLDQPNIPPPSTCVPGQ
ncbi:hypothetical protein D7Y13_16045 [Corallococcus praedator]|uniref:Uncharacterized protein n=1 Tax=Corallococcus praedator TaxID=2316724 RepID=A0ABX9QI61_9BACT|nr:MULTISPECIES: hypothetical protein [Corallococcus]RKH14457.1 hypothetical protein D7X74_19990 [Corallococcus sp. CA047B]RKH28842.1 hypothetical protein D7X75_23985 [Corallococcus sp. CA031C]RKI08435.1 hypothetical protein D7Y13_16045 [Corallococcus praedator]